MKLNTEKITKESRYWQQINSLAKEAFPPEEYLAPDKLVEMSEAENFDFLALTDEGDFVGFMVVQTYKNLAYLSYLGVDYEVFCMSEDFDPKEFKEMMKEIRVEGFEPKYFCK